MFYKNIQPFEQDLLIELSKLYKKNNFNSETNLISTNMRLNKIRLSEGLKKSSNFAFYEKHSPKWSDGYIISVLLPITAKNLILTIFNYLKDWIVKNYYKLIGWIING